MTKHYAIATLCCAVFSAVYEFFSHGVYSPFMVGLCAVPLMLGVVPSLVAWGLHARIPWVARQLWACAVLTLTLGCCYAGVLQIYGTTSPYLAVYAIAAGALCLGTLLSFIYEHHRRISADQGNLNLLKS